jgi:hypothetical protein
MKMKNNYTIKLQNMIDEVVENNPQIKFKTCPHCGRVFPLHNIFFTNNSSNKNGFANRCRECLNQKYNFSFDKEYDKLHTKKWYDGKEEEFKKLYRIMSWQELMNYYNVEKNEIKNMVRRLKINNLDVNDYTNDEIIFMYTNLLNHKRLDFPDRFDKIYKYKIVIIKYLINNILKWDKNDICRKWSTDVLSKYRLSTFTTNDSFELLNKAFPDYTLKRWELINSAMPHDFWKNKNNVNEVIEWLKIQLKNNENIDNIYQAREYGFGKILIKYNLDGCRQSINKTYQEFFEFIYNIEMKSIFKSNNKELNKFEDIIYIIKPKNYTLDKKGKKLINEIIKFCEIERHFPSMKELTNKNGYISYARFKEYFNGFINIYKYIKPINKTIPSYWLDKENRIYEFKNYCENICEENILNNMETYKDLLSWTRKYYQNNKDIRTMVRNIGHTKYHSSYFYLIEAYPEIQLKHTLFEWEFNRYCPKNNNDINMMLKELILYRLNDCILNLEKDIPRYLNCPYINNVYPKFNNFIIKKRFKNYYEWAINVFPEYKEVWTEQDFGIIQSKDGIEFDSHEEKNIYEYMKFQINIFKYIKFIGRCKNNGKYVFQLDDEYEYTNFCPDFVIESIAYNNKKQKLKKPIIIEYYGYYHENNQHKIFQEYVKRTKVKEKFYKSNKDIYYLGIFPEDLKNNFEGLTKKLNLFYLQKIKNNILDVEEYKSVI